MRKRSRYEGYFKDIAGQSFGRLVAVHPTELRDKKGSVVWACLCECKTVTYVTEDALVNETTKSCGCLKEEYRDNIGDTLHFVDGTCVEWIENRKHRSDNTSGFRGVQKIRDDRYRVTIGFKGQKYHLGYFKTFDKAKEARLKAEEELYAPFLEEFYAEGEQPPKAGKDK